jgi:outer membrane receptor protein involved in Fe transport
MLKQSLHTGIKGLLSLLCCFISTLLLAQQKGRIEGQVLDKTIPLEFVTVTLSKLEDTSKVAYYSTTDTVGLFAFKQVEFGNYLLKFSLIGYQPSAQKISVTTASNLLKIESLVLIRDTNFLRSITVTSTKKLMEKTPEGFIVNAAANITATGGTATDILKNTPTVSVDAEGSITLRGKAPLILINGRNSNLNNPDQIPASSVESIEIINNATARYDANAESGIINIKLKKNKQNGTNGALALGAGLGGHGRINSSLLINHKTRIWNLGLSYDNRFAERTREINGSRKNFYLPDEYLLEQNRYDKRLEQLQNLKINADFSPNVKNTFSFEFIANMEGQDNNESLNSALYKQDDDLNSNINRHSIELERSKVAEFAFDYSKKFSNQRKSLVANVATSINRDRENTDITSQSLDKNDIITGNAWYQRTHNYENGSVSSGQLDYAFPVSKKGLVETGYKGIYRSVNADFQVFDLVNNIYLVNSVATDIFKFNEQVHAAYVQFSSGFGKGMNESWKFNGGLRAEQVLNDGNTNSNSTKFNNSYLKFFPTSSLAYYAKADEFLKLSYSKRINRPGLGQLNPFTDITDSLNPHSGNPNLKPEIIHAIEMSYNKDWKNYSISSSFFYRYSLNTIRQYSQFQSNGVTLTLPVNIGNATTYGIESVFNAKPAIFFDFNASFSLFEQQLNGRNVSTEAVQNAFGWYAKLINNFVPWRDGKLQVTGNYNSSLPTPQGKRIAQYFADFGFQQKLGKGNARLGLTVTDVFNTFKSGYINNTAAFSNYRYGKADTRAFVITFAYFFKSAFKEKLLENKFSTDY